MYRITNILKSQLKKYMPAPLYFFLYTHIESARQLISTTGTKSLPLFTKVTVRKVSVDDVEFDIELNPANGLVDQEIFSKGVWEREMLREIGTHLRADSVCLDIGANIGQHALYMASIATSGSVYAFEPIQSLAEQIERSVALNAMKNITVCQFGLSNIAERRPIYLNNLNMGNTTFRKRLGASTVVQAETKVFDDFWNTTSSIDFIKIDVEGYEYFALQGMRESLKAYHPTIIMEFTPAVYTKMNISSTEFLKYMFDLGYALYDLEDNKREITRTNIPDFLVRTPSQTNIVCVAM